ALVPLLAPWVSVVVVAELLPEAALVAEHQVEAGDPLGGLPEVQVRHEEPGGAAVLGAQRLAVVFVGDPCLAVAQVRQRRVRRVAAIAAGHDISGVRLDAVEQRVERDAAPVRAELGPLSDAVDVRGDGLGRQGGELLPVPTGRLAGLRRDRERPGGGVDRRGGPRLEDREAVLKVLAGRQLGIIAPTPGEASGDSVHNTGLMNGGGYASRRGPGR